MNIPDKRVTGIRQIPNRLLLTYIRSHWLGQQSLARSFWLNLLGLRILIFTLQSILSPYAPQDIFTWRWSVLLLVIVFHGAILIWQIVGVVRAAEADFAVRGNMALVWGAQLGAVLFLILSVIYSMEAMQLTMIPKHEEDPFARMQREHASQYSLTVNAFGQQLSIDGSIELGITKAVAQLIENHPEISQINLNSSGGNIYEARGLARLFSARGLDTHIQQTCASACTTAYVGGVNRSAAPDAMFGFHQYRVDAAYAILVTDVQREQERDAGLFIEAGVSKEFVITMFDRVPEDMWWPAMQELVQAGFVNE